MDRGASAGERAAWLRLEQVEGLGPAGGRRLLGHFGLPERIFAATYSTLRGVVPEIIARRVSAPPTPALLALGESLERWLADDPRHHFLTLPDSTYPKALLSTADPPLVLYAAGDLGQLELTGLAVVGSRSATRQGEENAFAFSQRLAQHGYSIISGLATGIDAAAHRGALTASGGGSTIAVLGTGIDRVYPAVHRGLARQIHESGLLLSELPLGTPARPWHFPRRNRLIAGLGRGVLVVEAAVQSGSLITARLAADSGREVFAIPGSIHTPLARGCHRLIRQGAKLVETAQDVIEELGAAGTALPPASPAKDDQAHEALGPDDGHRARVLAQLAGDAVDFDTLAQRTSLGAAELAAALFELEWTQDIEGLAGNRYQRLRKYSQGG